MVGGVFSIRPDSTYDGLHLTTSNFLMAYSDFPPKDDWIKCVSVARGAHRECAALRQVLAQGGVRQVPRGLHGQL